MSGYWITLVPEDPHFVPGTDAQLKARDRLAGIAPQAAAVELESFDAVQFFDCGANFERIHCPSCDTEIPAAWWQQRMDDDYEGGFKLASYRTPCCQSETSLRNLTYEWPQTFGRFALHAQNANIGKLEDVHRHELEEILKTKLTIIYRHL